MFPHTNIRMGESYSPLYFLAALGAGGLVVTFFMWLLFWVPHPGRPVPIFADILAAFNAGGLAMQTAIAVAWLGIAVFTVMHLRLLIWNIAELLRFRAGRRCARGWAPPRCRPVPGCRRRCGGCAV